MAKIPELKLLLDRPNNTNVKIFERLCVELSPYLTPMEVDKVVEFLNTIDGSKFDINPTLSDSVTQLKLIIGEERYEEAKTIWKSKNQKLLSVFGTRKYVYKDRRNDIQYDGLDPEDNPNDFEIVYV